MDDLALIGTFGIFNKNRLHDSIVFAKMLINNIMFWMFTKSHTNRKWRLSQWSEYASWIV